jgi:hypothetical protein
MKKTFILMFLLAGCASPQGYWHKEGLTQEEYAKTKYLCLQQAQQPESQHWFASKYSAAPVSSAQGEANRMSNAMREGMLAGLNSSSKNETGMVTNDMLFSACMNAHGLYWKVKE